MKQKQRFKGKEFRSKLRKEDVVMIIAGKEKGKSGKILEIDSKTSRVVVEGRNIHKKTVKKSQENPTGGIIEKEMPIHISNVMYLDGDKTSRLGYKFEDGKKLRLIKKSDRVLK